MVGFFGAAPLLAPIILATSAALTNAVFPPFWSSPNRSSCPAISILSPCSRGLGCIPNCTPLTITTASAEPRRIETPLAPSETIALLTGSPSGNRIPAPSRAPMVVSPAASGYWLSRSFR